MAGMGGCNYLHIYLPYFLCAYFLFHQTSQFIVVLVHHFDWILKKRFWNFIKQSASEPYKKFVWFLNFKYFYPFCEKCASLNLFPSFDLIVTASYNYLLHIDKVKHSQVRGNHHRGFSFFYRTFYAMSFECNLYVR